MSGSKRPGNNIEISLPPARLTVSDASCPEGCQLVTDERRINNSPSIGIRISFNGTTEMIYLDPQYGSFNNECAVEIPDNQVVSFNCPHCNASLQDEEERCLTCSTPLFVLHLPSGGILEGCLRKGCGFHKLQIVDLDEQFARLYGEHLNHVGLSL